MKKECTNCRWAPGGGCRHPKVVAAWWEQSHPCLDPSGAWLKAEDFAYALWEPAESEPAPEPQEPPSCVSCLLRPKCKDHELLWDYVRLMYQDLGERLSQPVCWDQLLDDTATSIEAAVAANCEHYCGAVLEEEEQEQERKCGVCVHRKLRVDVEPCASCYTDIQRPGWCPSGKCGACRYAGCSPTDEPCGTCLAVLCVTGAGYTSWEPVA